MTVEDLLHPFLGTYVAAPQWVKSSFGRLYSWVPKRMRYGPNYSRFKQELQICYDPPHLAAAVRSKLAATLHHALKTVPAYSSYQHLLKQDLDPLELLQQFPLIGKDQIKADLDSFVSTAFGPAQRLPMFTGGSTANPMRFYFHKHVTRPKEGAYVEDFDRLAGHLSGAVILNLRGRNVPGAGEAGKPMWLFEPIKRHLILSSDHLEPSYMPAYVEALRQWKPSFVHAFPSALYPLARWLNEHPAPDVVAQIQGVELTSENTYPYQLELFRKVFHCPILRHYGHTERVLFASSMPDDNRYFFWPLYGHLEIVDEKGAPITEPGVLGEIVGTSFDNEVMPFVRYKTSDFGAWGHEPHPQLPGWPVLERIEGRLQEFVVCADHRLISVTTLGAAHFTSLANVRNMQYEQFEPGRILIKVVADRALSDDEKRSISEAVRVKTQGGCGVEIQHVTDIERTRLGKHRMLIQHLDISGYLGAAFIEDVH
jgi:phenylacetate-CoA ligase